MGNASRQNRKMNFTASIAVVLLCSGLSAQTASVIDLRGSQTVLEYTGQVTNIGAASIQVGYLSTVKGFGNVFSGAPQDETTALFTFYTSVLTTRNVLNGTIRSVDRDGATTLYLAKGPADFSKPDSFRSGTPIQTSSMHQHVLVDTVTGGFTVTNFNIINSTPVFNLSGADYQLGMPGQTFRTFLTGHLTATAPPSGYFSGDALGGNDSIPYLGVAPNPAAPVDSSGLVQVTLSWGASGAANVELHVGAPDGPLMTAGGASGSATSGAWVSNGTRFYLQDVSGGKPLTAANTLAQVTAIVR